jgi:hypothetical protein
MKKGVERDKAKKNFVWYALRIGFYTMIISAIIYFLVKPATIVLGESHLSPFAFYLLVSYLFIASAFFTFVISIIHLKKYKEKALAIVSLVLSAIIVLISLWAIIFGPINIS